MTPRRQPRDFHYGGLVLAVDGKMKLLREFIDQVPAAIALLPHGIADIPGVGS